MNSCTKKLSQVSLYFLSNELNAFFNCIMLIHNFRTVDETGYLLLVRAIKKLGNPKI